jgi:hypothetical protein
MGRTTPAAGGEDNTASEKSGLEMHEREEKQAERSWEEQQRRVRRELRYFPISPFRAQAGEEGEADTNGGFVFFLRRYSSRRAYHIWLVASGREPLHRGHILPTILGRGWA